jgi:HEAT repeat protein
MSEPSVEELFAAALAKPWDSDERWEQIRALQDRGGREVFDAAAALCGSSVPDEQTVGADVLGQVGPWVRHGLGLRDSADPALHADAADLLLGMLEHEQDIAVLDSVCTALGHLEDPRRIEPLVELRTHPHETVRFAVVFGLLEVEDDRAVEALIELSADEDSDVRDWATFGLGAQIERDTPAVREALAARLGDADEDTHEEALIGLGLRGDPRAIEPLLKWREDYEGYRLDEALWQLAAKTGDPRLRDEVERSLNELREEDPDGELPDELDAARARLGLA